jgi:hypothetical protein
MQSSRLIDPPIQTNANGFDQGLTFESIQELPTDDNLVKTEQPDPEPVVENPDGTLTNRPEALNVGISDASIDQLQYSPERVGLWIEVEFY